MKIVSLAALLAVTLAAPALAQAGGGPTALEHFPTADTNGDGFVSRDEFMTLRAANFNRFDRNDDGFLSADDLPTFAANGPRGQQFSAMVAEFDTDKDARLSYDEFANGPTLMFDRVDANQDGAVSQDELATAAAAFRANQ